MNFNKLVAFGCSNTFGRSLPDDADGYVPSKYSWPFLLSKLFDIEILNLGIPGASNKQILYNILNYNFKQNNVVFVLWTYPNRHCIIHSKNSVEKIGNWLMPFKKSKTFFKMFYTEYDQKITDCFYYNLANLYLQQKKIKHIFLIPNNKCINLDINWQLVKFLNVFFDDLKTMYPFASDNMHLGTEGHKNFAHTIFNKYMTNDYYLGGK